jgi:hypothetical protein
MSAILKHACPACDKPIYLTDPRRRTVNGLVHKECADGNHLAPARTASAPKQRRHPVPETISAELLRKVLGADAAREVLAKVWAATVQPLSLDQLDALIRFCEHSADFTTREAYKLLEPLRAFYTEHPHALKRIMDWAQQTKVTGGIPGGLPVELHAETPALDESPVASNGANGDGGWRGEVVAALAQHGSEGTTIKGIASALGKSSSTIRDRLVTLQREGAIEPAGTHTSRGGTVTQWRVTRGH